ncbi:putative transcription regulator mTERF family [Helianthus annuus]|nr:putative transcription regulator mTERF family [Helianthus annuus]
MALAIAADTSVSFLCQPPTTYALLRHSFFPVSSPLHFPSLCPPPSNTRRLVHHPSPCRRPLYLSSSSSSSSSSTADEEDEKQAAAIDAVSDILRENGVSEEEAMEIAVNSPKYVEMLMDSVRDLDDLFQSNSSSSSCSYKKKVFEMGRQKGDKGLVPLLESMVGLPLPSAMHIARYLSPHTASKLLHKVKYVKEILYTDLDGKVPIARSACRMMMHLSVSVDDDLQHTLSFLEKIQARRGGLALLGSGDGSFRYLIESFPRLLLLSVESNMKPVVDFLEHIGVPKGCIRNVLLLYPPILFYDIEKDIKPRKQVFTKV